jgi:hypothetical protein
VTTIKTWTKADTGSIGFIGSHRNADVTLIGEQLRILKRGIRQTCR